MAITFLISVRQDKILCKQPALTSFLISRILLISDLTYTSTSPKYMSRYRYMTARRYDGEEKDVNVKLE